MSSFEQVPPGSAIITPNDMLAELRQVGKAIDHLAAIVDPALAEIRRDLVETDKRAVLLEARMRVIENWRWFVLGISAVVGTMAGYSASLLVGG